MVFERVDANAVDRIDEKLFLDALSHIDFQQATNHFRHLSGGERGADDFANGTGIALRTTDGNLVPLRAILVDPENTDIADMMMTAGVDAARAIQLDVADVMLKIDIVETLCNGLCDRDGFGIGK